MKKISGLYVEWSEWFSKTLTTSLSDRQWKMMLLLVLKIKGIPREEMVVRVKDALEKVRMS